MTPEELLRPRYKVIADYPKSIYQVGEIRNVGINGDLLYCDWDGPRMSDYPHLFRKMHWWEDRKIEDMPQYLRYGFFDTQHTIYKAESYNLFLNEAWTTVRNQEYHLPFTRICFPATEAEYLEYASK